MPDKSKAIETSRISQVMRSFLVKATHENATKIVGKALTVVDAISENETRRKAIHDLMQQAIWTGIDDLRMQMFYACDCLSDKLGESHPPSNIGVVGRASIFKD